MKSGWLSWGLSVMLALFVLMSVSAHAADHDNPNTLFILDASGSMWGQIDGKPKITIAKEVMTKLVGELPENARLGLIAYGHRRKSDCTDVQTLVSLGPNQNQAILDAVNKLNAKGKTPLSLSVQQAMDMLRNEDGPSRVVLVSDGIESCNADPCATVKAAKAAGVNFVLYTVGFGLKTGEAGQLQCMANAGGGQYYQANNAEQLLEATRQALKPTGTLRITVKVNGEISDFLYRVEAKATGKSVSENTLPSPSQIPIALQAGQYRVFVRPGGVNGTREKVLEDIEIKIGETVSKTVNFDKGTLRLTVTIDGKPVHAQVHVEDPKSHDWIYQSSVFGTDTPITIALPAGKIDIVVQADGDTYPERRVEGVMIQASQVNEQRIAVDGNNEVAFKTNAADEIEENTDRPGGGDYRHFIPSAADAQLCLKACQSDAQCKAWTYVKPDTVQGPQPNCWLKQTIPAAVPNHCCDSGIKPEKSP